MCLLEQIGLGGCVLNGRAPGVLNNDSQSPLARSVWEKSEWKNLLSKQRPAVVFAVRPERLSSAVHIVFEQLALICHLVEGAFVAREGKHCAIINSESTYGDKRGDNALYLGSALVHFIDMTVYQAIRQK